jgi:pantoate--beta-alanine ligase
MRHELAAASLGNVDYVSVADAETLQELEVVDRPALASLAVRFPSARLIDCQPLEPERP